MTYRSFETGNAESKSRKWLDHSSIIIMALISSGASVISAEAKVIRNPVYDIDYDKVCYPEKNVKPGESVKPSAIKYYKRQSSGKKTYRIVKRDQVIETLLNRYPVKIEYSELLKLTQQDFDDANPTELFPISERDWLTHRNQSKSDHTQNVKSFRELLAEKVAPCDITRIISTSEPPDKDCEPKTINQADTLRFSGKTEALKFRRALLRLFEAAETGTQTDFAVIRKNWLESERLKIIETQQSAITYRPVVRPYIDDTVIRAYLLDVPADDITESEYLEHEGKNSPFDLYCLHPGDQKNYDGHLFVEPDEELDADTTANWNVVHQVSRPAEFSHILNDAATWGKEKPVKDDEINDVKQGWKFSLVESAEEFAKQKPDGASFKISDGGTDDGISFDAAVGLSYSWTDSRKANKWTYRYAVTPYAAIDQRPAKYTFFTDEIGADGGFETATRPIALADMAAGIRLDLAWRKEGDWNVTNRPDTRSGYKIPDWRVGLAVERLTDNNANRLGLRGVADISLPRDWIDIRGFRHRETFGSREFYQSSSQRLPRKTNYLRSLASGWAIEWDLIGKLEALDFDTGRTPLDLSNPDPNARLNQDFIDTVLLGFGLEAELSKSNLFGAILDESWLKLEGRLDWRTGYDDGPTGELDAEMNPIINTSSTAYNGEVKLTLQHPDFSKYGLTFGYEFGESFTDLSDLDVLSFGLSATY